jgi:hypothetical protein
VLRLGLQPWRRYFKGGRARRLGARRRPWTGEHTRKGAESYAGGEGGAPTTVGGAAPAAAGGGAPATTGGVLGGGIAGKVES